MASDYDWASIDHGSMLNILVILSNWFESEWMNDIFSVLIWI